MSPINGGYCPLLLEENSPSGKVYFCSDYENRPDECVNHKTPGSICAVGKSDLKITTDLELKNRLLDIKKVLIDKNSLHFFLK